MGARTWNCLIMACAVCFATVPLEGQVVYLARSFGPVMRANLNRDRQLTIIAESDRIADFALDTRGNRIYWANLYPGYIDSSNLDGSDRSRVVTASEGVLILGVSVDSAHQKLYWIQEPNSATGKVGDIRCANLDGTESEVVYSSDSPTDGLRKVIVEPERGRIYWSEFVGSVGGVEIRHADFDGSDVVTAVLRYISTLGDFDIDPEGENLWWAQRRVDTGIIRADLSGGNAIVVLPNVFGSPLTIAPSDGYLYFVTTTTDQPAAREVLRLELDGSGVEFVMELGEGSDVVAITVDDRAPGDCNGDGGTSISDVVMFTACMTGPKDRLAENCLCSDATGDSAVDLADFAELQVAFH